MPKRPLTPTYIFFFLLFWPDTWRIAMGLAVALIFTSYIGKTDGSPIETGMIAIMMAAIGYAVSAKPAQIISAKLRSLILNKH